MSPRAKHRLRIFYAAGQWRWRCYRPASGFVCHADHATSHPDALAKACAHLDTHRSPR